MIKKVLIIEDEPEAIVYITQLMESFKEYKIVGVFKNGSTALEFICKNEVDLLLLDMEIPGIKGFDILRAVHDKILAAIVISGCSQYAIESFGIEKHFVIDYIRKPIYLDALVSALNKYAENIALIQAKKIVENEIHNPLLTVMAKAERMRTLKKSTFVHIEKFSTHRYACRIWDIHGRQHEVKSALQDIMIKLPDHFIQISKKDIINLKKVVIDEQKENVYIKSLKKSLEISRFFEISKEKIEKYKVKILPVR